MSKLGLNLHGMVLLGVLSGFVCPANAENTTRSCDAFYQWETTGGSFGGTFGKFAGKGGCGTTVPNRCRERARDAAMACMTTHRDIRWERRTPEACLNAAGVYGYNIGLKPCITTSSNQCLESPRHEVPAGDLKTRLEVEVCCALGKPSHHKLRCEKKVHVRLRAVVTGGDRCGKTRELFDDYVIDDCGDVWTKICAQTPQQPAGC